jgi:hypothetical protein
MRAFRRVEFFVIIQPINRHVSPVVTAMPAECKTSV